MSADRKPLPDFRAGQRPNEWSASELRNLISQLRSVSNIRGGRGVAVRHTETGVVIELVSTNSPENIDKIRWCGVVGANLNETRISIAEIVYDQSGIIQWGDLWVDAVPSYGSSVAEILAQKITPLEDQPPASGPFFPFQKLGDEWMVWNLKAGSPVSLVILRAVSPDDTGAILTASPVNLNSEGQYIIDDEEAEEVMTWYGLQARDYTPWVYPVSAGNVALDQTKILEAAVVDDGTVRIRQGMRFAFPYQGLVPLLNDAAPAFVP